MDPSMISQILARLRGDPQGMPQALQAAGPQGTPPMGGGAPPNPMMLAMADPSQQGAPPAQPNPMMPNPGLEQQAIAGGGQQPMNPMIEQIMKHFGMLNFLRNRSNQQVTDPSMMQN